MSENTVPMEDNYFGPEPYFVLPGDIIDPQQFYTFDSKHEKVQANDKVVKLGPGLVQKQGSDIVSTAAGILHHNHFNNRFWVDFNLKRYVPSTGDSVIGVISKKHGEQYAVDLGASVQANMSVLAFEGATKRSRPNLQIGDLVYAKVVLAHKDIEPELEAFNSYTGKSEGFGILDKGFVFKCSIGLCRSLLSPKCSVLSALGSQMAFELAIGLNGTVWISSKNPKQTILIKNAILNSENISDPIECQKMVSGLMLDI